MVEAMTSFIVFFAQSFSFSAETHRIDDTLLASSRLRTDSDLLHQVVLFNYILKNICVSIEMPGVRKDGDILIFLSFFILANGRTSDISSCVSNLICNNDNMLNYNCRIVCPL